MRPNQQNNKNRSRGRNNNGGRKHGNPLSRNYESNGPDVKVRGNAAHIAEKYVQLARDAQSSGDSVMAENYLQHAEHYFRILSAAQAQTQTRNDGFSAQVEEDDYDDDFAPINDRFSMPERAQFQQAQPQPQPQPQPGQDAAPAASDGNADANAATDASGAGDGEAQAAGEGEPRRRERRPRRRSRSAAAAGEGGDPATQPQPDMGELPAFLTGAQSAAE